MISNTELKVMAVILIFTMIMEGSLVLISLTKTQLIYLVRCFKGYIANQFHQNKLELWIFSDQSTTMSMAQVETHIFKATMVALQQRCTIRLLLIPELSLKITCAPTNQIVHILKDDVTQIQIISKI